MGWDDFPRRQAAARAQGRYLGMGLAHGVKGTGRGPFEFGGVRVSPTGGITVSTGAAAMGQGVATALAQICAAAFGVRAQDVTVVAGDTAAAPLGLGGFASRQTVTAGSSVHVAAQAVAAKARKLASHVLEAAEDDLEVVDGEVRVVGAPQLSVKLGELARILKGAPGYGFPPGLDPGLEASAMVRFDALAYSNACHVAEVEVDIETGAVAIVRYAAIQDAGRRVNPMIVEGQIHGGIAHGIGNAMFEWMGYDAAGQPVTTTFADYLLPTATEVPKIETLYKETPSPRNPLGVKGVGELGVIPAAAALISAIEDALSPFNVHIAQMPIMPHELVAHDRTWQNDARAMNNESSFEGRSNCAARPTRCKENKMTRLKSALRILLSAVLLGAAAVTPVRADNFPSRPLHLIMPYSPGGIVDFTGRVVAQKLGEVLGQTVVPENRPGAGGIVGVDYVAHSAPDGYNFVIMDPAIVINPTLQKSALRHFQGPGDDLDRQLVAGSSGGRAGTRHQNLRRACRLRQSQSGQAQLRVRRRRHGAASRRRHVGASHRHPGDPRAVQGRRAVLRRPDEQQGADAVLQHRGRSALHVERQRHSARHHRPQTLAGLSRCADGG